MLVFYLLVTSLCFYNILIVQKSRYLISSDIKIEYLEPIGTYIGNILVEANTALNM